MIRKDQLLVPKSIVLRIRTGVVNRDLPVEKRALEPDHQWGCPGCGTRNDYQYLSCRVCETLRWGVCP